MKNEAAQERATGALATGALRYRFGVRDLKTAKPPIFCTGHADIAQNVGRAAFRPPRRC
jgi:hypothetical protein